MRRMNGVNSNLTGLRVSLIEVTLYMTVVISRLIEITREMTRIILSLTATAVT